MSFPIIIKRAKTVKEKKNKMKKEMKRVGVKNEVVKYEIYRIR
jgi:hypothetical protein